MRISKMRFYGDGETEDILFNLTDPLDYSDANTKFVLILLSN